MRAEHGSFRSYRRGCRCDHCRAAAAERTYRYKNGAHLPEDGVVPRPTPVDLESLDPVEVLRAIKDQMCPFCGRGRFKMVVAHISKVHDLDRYAIRDALGVYYRETLCSPELAQMRRIAAERMLEEGILDPPHDGPKHTYRRSRKGREQARKAQKKAAESWSAKAQRRYEQLRAEWESGATVQEMAEARGFSNGYMSELLKRAGCDVPNQKDVLREQLDRDTPHGTFRRYSTFGCRCDSCRAANAERARRDRQRRHETSRNVDVPNPP